MLKKLLYSFLIICSISCIAFAEDLPAYVIENSDYGKTFGDVHFLAHLQTVWYEALSK